MPNCIAVVVVAEGSIDPGLESPIPFAHMRVLVVSPVVAWTGTAPTSRPPLSLVAESSVTRIRPGTPGRVGRRRCCPAGTGPRGDDQSPSGMSKARPHIANVKLTTGELLIQHGAARRRDPDMLGLTASMMASASRSPSLWSSSKNSTVIVSPSRAHMFPSSRPVRRSRIADHLIEP